MYCRTKSRVDFLEKRLVNIWDDTGIRDLRVQVGRMNNLGMVHKKTSYVYSLYEWSGIGSELGL